MRAMCYLCGLNFLLLYNSVNVQDLRRKDTENWRWRNELTIIEVNERLERKKAESVSGFGLRLSDNGVESHEKG
jgi:hypothetical protein